MKNLLGYILWLLAIAITIIVVLSKYHLFETPVVANLLEKDYAASLLVAIVLSLVAKWV